MAGRVVMGLYVALLRKARVITFSTGASEKDGLKEAEYTYKFIMDRLVPLAALLSRKLGRHITAPALRAWISARAELDTVSQNTVEETAANLELALARGCREIIGVTNAFHAPRCLAGLQAARIKYDSPLFISVVPAYDEDYGTVILEAPHRGDRPKTEWHIFARLFFRVPEEHRIEFEQKLKVLFSEFQ